MSAREDIYPILESAFRAFANLMEMENKARNNEPIGPSTANYAANVIDLAGKIHNWGSANQPSHQAAMAPSPTNLTGRWTDGELGLSLVHEGSSIAIDDAGNRYFGAAISDAYRVQFLASGTGSQGEFIIWRGEGDGKSLRMTIWNRSSGGFGSFEIHPG
ncbi:hypothetical protein ACGFRG_01270 [Streptomyces sp. NPDC048696]|uniref:hypothetical protein n=1 Tax=Streptomyces sp. NPDC048696 TaxID=3365585 RepID=UPI0037168919